MRVLKVISPFRGKEEVIPLIEAGADELYCGYLSPKWIERYTSLEFERKGGKGSNFGDLKELKEAVDLAHGKNVPVYLTLNGLYVNSQYPLLLEIVEQLEKIDLDGFIVADIGLLLTLRKLKTKKQLHISTGGTVFNSQAVDFYKKLGASRIILDRQTTFESMRRLSESFSDIDFEVFIFTTLCVYIDGFCTFLHTYSRDSLEDISKKDWKKDERFYIATAFDIETQADACCLKYSLEAFDFESKKKINTSIVRPTFYKQLVDGVECGACAIYDIIMHTKVKSIKVVGRQLNPQIRLESTKFIRACLDILEDGREINRQDYISKVQSLYQKTFEYKERCRGNNCYHPEVLSRKVYGESHLYYQT